MAARVASRLSAEQKEKIVQLYAQGVAAGMLAQRFGVSKWMVHSLVKRVA